MCPCHQAEFSADGQHRPTPNYDRQLAPLATFPVKQLGSLVYVYAADPGENQSLDDDEDYSKP